VSLLSILFALCLSVCLFKGSKDNREATQLTQNKNQLRILDCAAPGLVRLRAPGGAQD
jgi:hypothetical protein